ncbi:ABC transporter ATP-binding protein [Sphaerisporangium sp. NPDC051011]|uniref:ABC transporter ATP-binding protein n=1 Tax=Sphaerisporangium sp. NPDC051011 TaxID=3155792 RepID=UPI0033FD3BA3
MSALELKGLTVSYGKGRRVMTAVDNVDLTIPSGGFLGLVGESGSGKSSLGRAVAGLAPVTSGLILVDGAPLARRSLFGRTAQPVQMIFQDPSGSLDPRMTVGASIAEGVAAGGARGGRADRSAEVRRLLELVSLDPRHATSLPSRLSGGQRQRVALARALASAPSLLVADEITSALDVSVQGSVLNVVREAVATLNITTLFISHNLAVVTAMCDEIAVMYAGRIVEKAPTAELVSRPRHPYTRALLDAVPSLRQPAPRADAKVLDAEPPDPFHLPAGCPFNPRCPAGPGVHADRQICTERRPQFVELNARHLAACHFPGAVTHDTVERSAHANASLPT